MVANDITWSDHTEWLTQVRQSHSEEEETENMRRWTCNWHSNSRMYAFAKRRVSESAEFSDTVAMALKHDDTSYVSSYTEKNTNDFYETLDFEKFIKRQWEWWWILCHFLLPFKCSDIAPIKRWTLSSVLFRCSAQLQCIRWRSLTCALEGQRLVKEKEKEVYCEMLQRSRGHAEWKITLSRWLR